MHKPKVSAPSACTTFPPLDEQPWKGHLRGTHTLGVYAIGTDGTAVSSRRLRWRLEDDVLAYREAAERISVTVGVERSRRGAARTPDFRYPCWPQRREDSARFSWPKLAAADAA